MKPDTKKYHTFDPSVGYPAGPNLIFECLKCGESIPSRPSDNVSCKCHNIMIDVDYGRIRIKDYAQVRLYSTAE